MKPLIQICLIGAAIAAVGVFFEIWSISKLENMPTISDYLKNSKKPENTEKKNITGSEERPWGGQLEPKENDGARAKQLKHAAGSLNQKN